MSNRSAQLRDIGRYCGIADAQVKTSGGGRGQDIRGSGASDRPEQGRGQMMRERRARLAGLAQLISQLVVAAFDIVRVLGAVAVPQRVAQRADRDLAVPALGLRYGQSIEDLAQHRDVVSLFKGRPALEQQLQRLLELAELD
jgi:hypothetical protein